MLRIIGGEHRTEYHIADNADMKSESTENGLAKRMHEDNLSRKKERRLSEQVEKIHEKRISDLKRKKKWTAVADVSAVRKPEPRSNLGSDLQF